MHDPVEDSTLIRIFGRGVFPGKVRVIRREGQKKGGGGDDLPLGWSSYKFNTLRVFPLMHGVALSCKLYIGNHVHLDHRTHSACRAGTCAMDTHLRCLSGE